MSLFRDIFGAKGVCLRRQTGGRRPLALISNRWVSESREVLNL